jgi:hypothetical protein
MTIGVLKNPIDEEEDGGAESLTEPLLDYYPPISEKLWPKYSFSPPTQAGAFTPLHDLTLVCFFDFLPDAAICCAVRACKALRVAAGDSEYVSSQKRARLPTLQSVRNRELLKGKNRSRLRYCGANGMMAHHWSSIHVFLNWERYIDAARTKQASGASSSTQAGADETGSAEAEDEAMREPTGASWSGLPEAAIRAVLAMSLDVEVGCTSSLSSAFRRVSRLDGAVRCRRREGMARMEAKKGKKGGKDKKKRQPRPGTRGRGKTREKAKKAETPTK